MNNLSGITEVEIKKAWWSQGGDADGYSCIVLKLKTAIGRPKVTYWTPVPLRHDSAHIWKPFLNSVGITLRQIKTGTVLSDKDGRFGERILSIGDWEPGDGTRYLVDLDKRIRFV